MEDKELIALLDRKFAEQEERIEGRFAPRFEQIDRRFEHIDRRFEQIDRRFEQIDSRFDSLETKVGTIQIAVYKLQDDLQRNNELIHLVDNKLDRFRTETRNNFKSVHATLGVANKALVGRIRKLEKKAS